MALTREEKKQKTRTAIINAAIRLFGEKGFDKTSIEELAREAGIGKGTIYTYFQTKAEIFHAFCEDQLDYIHVELAKVNDVDAPLIEQMMTIYMGEFRHVTQNKEFGRIFMQQIVFPHDTDQTKFQEIDAKWISLVFAVYERAQARNELKQDQDLLYIAGHFYGLYIMIVSAWYAGRITSEEVEPGMRMLFQQALDGLTPSKEANDQKSGDYND